MLEPGLVIVSSVAYLGVLFALAWWGDRRADQGRSLISNPTIYALSLAVYCTSWTFYGSVGRAAASGVGFLPIYFGPTLVVLLWPFVLRKMIRISRAHRITSIADFVATRYGNSQLLGGLVTVIAIIGIAPYIGLQLKAVSTTSALLLQYPEVSLEGGTAPLWRDSAFYIAMAMAAFTIVFGTRHLDATERHEGMVAAIAFESVVKLMAFLAVGLFVTFWLYDGPGDLFERAAAHPELSRLFEIRASGGYESWFALTVLAALAFLFLPRQFQVAVVENVDERHVDRALWMFPLYLLAINLFVLPIAFGGVLHFGSGSQVADTFVLSLPMAEQRPMLALLAFIGGLSAATGMVIVETIALSTMVSNDLLMPILFRIRRLGLAQRANLSGLLLAIRRGAIIAVLLLGYLYFRAAGEAPTLVSIGLLSFAAIAQFAPAMLAAMYWRGATRRGAIAGLCTGFGLWIFTLLLPAIANAGVIGKDFIEHGLFGIAALKPAALFGLEGMGSITHGLFWSLLGNIGALVWVSLFSQRSIAESTQAALFVDILQRAEDSLPARLWRGSASLRDLQSVLGRFIGPTRASEALAAFAKRHGLRTDGRSIDPSLVQFAERLLAGAIGGASARVMIASVVKEEILSMDEVMEILDEASQVIVYSRQLEAKSRELEAATAELRAANERLTELDRMKDEFVSTVSHELLTPLTSIRAFSEILRDNPKLDPIQRHRYLDIVVAETERLTRLINDVLDLAKLESAGAEWHDEWQTPQTIVEAAAAATSQLFESRRVQLLARFDTAFRVLVDRDRLMQVIVNLLSNAAKFCPKEGGCVELRVHDNGAFLYIDVTDNGPGVPEAERDLIFEKFRQGGSTLTDKPTGTGLGLPISRQIVEHYGGRIEVQDAPAGGARFRVSLPLKSPSTTTDAATVR